jgi:beta-glucosidase
LISNPNYAKDLLKENEVAENKYKQILVTGPLAADKEHSLSRYGPNNTNIVSVVEGVKNVLKGKVNVEYQLGCNVADENWPESELYPLEMTEKEKKQFDAAIEVANKSDIIIAVMGETEQLVGESRSRTSLDLPGNQNAYLRALYATGKPVILVLINGRPMTINWPQKNIPAIIEAWFPGEYGGDAIAETIFGLYNPGGKLPMTFPKSIGQLEYNFPYKPGAHAGQPGDGPNGFGKTNVFGALYPFGYGLSYTSFAYSNLTVSPSFNKNDTVFVSIDITNTGNYDGDEVVQLYFKDDLSSVNV